tara:strand:- start:175653 stop:178187 length:2535 start_codon:yes stop_codon:yes gene_type:complete
MRISYWGLFLACFTLLASPVFSQGNNPSTTTTKKNKDLEKAEEAFKTLKYLVAIEYYKEAFSDAKGRESKSEILFKLGECYRLTSQWVEAEKNYQKAVKLGYKDPIAMLHQADMLKAQGEYEEALEVYQEYKKSNPTDPAGAQGIESTKEASEWENTPNLYQVSNMKDINSRYSEFCPVYAGKPNQTSEIIFTSAREESTGSDEDDWTGQPFYDLYSTSSERKGRRRRRGGAGDEDDLDVSKKSWSAPILLDEEEIVNTKHHEGALAFDSRKKKLYFTKCMQEDNEVLECGIWITEMQGTTWKAPELVIIGNDTNANVGHPCLSPDDKYLYFVSSAFNSRGGRDIFVSEYDRRRKSWGTPKNLGPKVNTELNERYPFAHDNGYLYFSSDGHPGMGGWDIYRIKVGADGLPLPNAKAENLKAPINSSSDDFSIVFEPGDDKKGFLASNRKGSNNNSDDIYAVFKTPVVFKLEGVITSSKDGQVIPVVSIKLEGGGASIEGIADKDGYYSFDNTQIKKDVAYHLVFEKEKFLSSQGDVTTVGVPMSAFEYLPSETKFQHTLRLNVTMDPIDEPIILPNVLFDTDKAFLKPASRKALDTVIYILNNNPRITIELRSHTDYIGNDASNDKLSRRRADSCVAYLIKNGIDAARLTAVGRGENEPRIIPEGYKDYGWEIFKPGTELKESYIKTLSAEHQAAANQINRRTDMKVLRDDYIPAEGLEEVEAVNPNDIINKKANEAPEPGKIYIVKGRESFGVIARKNKIKIQDLKKINGGLRGVRPFDGMQVKVEVDGNYEEWDASHYKVQRKGETFKSIAKKLDMDDDVLEDLNPDIDKKDLKPGLWILIK